MTEILKQVSVFIENTPGHLRKVCSVLAEAGVNLQTLSVAESRDYGIVRIIADSPDKAAEALSAAGIASKLVEVVAVEVADRPGALLSILDKAQAGGLNVEYMYAMTRGVNGNPLMIMRFGDTAKAAEVLK